MGCCPLSCCTDPCLHGTGCGCRAVQPTASAPALGVRRKTKTTASCTSRVGPGTPSTPQLQHYATAHPPTHVHAHRSPSPLTSRSARTPGGISSCESWSMSSDRCLRHCTGSTCAGGAGREGRRAVGIGAGCVKAPAGRPLQCDWDGQRARGAVLPWDASSPSSVHTTPCQPAALATSTGQPSARPCSSAHNRPFQRHYTLQPSHGGVRSPRCGPGRRLWAAAPPPPGASRSGSWSRPAGGEEGCSGARAAGCEGTLYHAPCRTHARLQRWVTGMA